MIGGSWAGTRTLEPGSHADAARIERGEVRRHRAAEGPERVIVAETLDGVFEQPA